jgi:hypothetical protein
MCSSWGLLKSISSLASLESKCGRTASQTKIGGAGVSPAIENNPHWLSWVRSASPNPSGEALAKRPVSTSTNEPRPSSLAPNTRMSNLLAKGCRRAETGGLFGMTCGGSRCFRKWRGTFSERLGFKKPEGDQRESGNPVGAGYFIPPHQLPQFPESF